jgi:ankyrin repeat protein
MLASENGHHDIVRTLLEGGADVNAQNKVRNQMMIITIIMMIIMIVVINDEDRNDCRRSMYLC